MVVNSAAHQWLGMPLGMNYGISEGDQFLSMVRLSYGLDGILDMRNLRGLGATGCPQADALWDDGLVDTTSYFDLCAREKQGEFTTMTPSSPVYAGNHVGVPPPSTAGNKVPVKSTQWINGVPNEAVVLGGFALVSMMMFSR